MKKFTWIFGLALLWGGLNAVAQTVKEVGTFKELKTAVDNIPQFKVVQEKKTAYNDAKAALATAEAKTATAKAAYDKVYPKIAAAETVLNNAKTTTQTAKSAYDDKHAEVTKAQGELATAEAAVITARTTYNNAKEATAKALTIWNNAKTATTTAKTAYDEAVEATAAVSPKTTLNWGTEQSATSVVYPEYEEFINSIIDEIEPDFTLHAILFQGIANKSRLFFIPVKSNDKGEEEEHTEGDYAIEVFSREELETLKSQITTEMKSVSGLSTPIEADITSYDEIESFEIFEDDDITVSTNRTWEIRLYYKENNEFKVGKNNVLSKNKVTSIDGALIEYGIEKLTRRPLIWVKTETNTTAYDQALAAETTAKTAYDNAVAAEATAQTAYDAAKEAERDAQTELGLAQNDVISAGNAVTAAQNEEKPYYDEWQAALSDQKTAQSAYDNAVADAADLKEAWDAAKNDEEPFRTKVESAKADYNKEAAKIAKVPAETDDEDLIICEDEYKTINITGMITVSGITEDYVWSEWPSGYTLDGNGNSIKSTKPLFRTNMGDIESLANVQAAIAAINNGTVMNCLTRRDANTYRVYRSSNDYTDYPSVEDAIYATQEEVLPFCYDMEKKEVLPYSEEYRLYQAQYANAANKNLYTFKLNIRSNQELKYDEAKFNKQFTAGYTSQNAVLYIDDEVAIAKVSGMKNVAVMENGAYTCHNTVLEEGTGVKGFYIPKDFVSEKLSYMRNFTQKVSAVCLPFKLDDETQDLLGYDNTFQFSNVDTSTGVMWFTTRPTIEANKPCLISFSDANENRTIFADITSTLQFKATPDKLVASSANGEEFYGLYTSSTADELTDNKGEAVYGIQNGLLAKAKPTARLQQFRSYVKRPNTVAANEAPSYNIGLMDEDGNELSTAIETVTGEIISGFKAKGSDNAIEVSTDEACQVKVYTLNGALVKSTRVEAGTTSLPVKAGIYVVNGAKVIVK